MNRHSIARNTRHNIIDRKKIQVTTLSSILEKHVPKNQKIDFLNVDVEGVDINVLRSNNWKKFRPDYILVESQLDLKKLKNNTIYSLLCSHGYWLAGKTKRTLIFSCIYPT